MVAFGIVELEGRGWVEGAFHYKPIIDTEYQKKVQFVIQGLNF